MILIGVLVLLLSVLSQLTTSIESPPQPPGQQLVLAEKIFCDAENTLQASEEVFKYDCSHKNLTSFSLIQLIDHIRGSTSLDLAYNSLSTPSPILRNLTFNLFKQLINLNLTSNGLRTAESHAFFYVNTISDTIDTTYLQNLDPDQLHALRLVSLDLSGNQFVRIPWNSVRSLPGLAVLHLDRNPIKAFDLGDWTPGIELPPASDTLLALVSCLWDFFLFF